MSYRRWYNSQKVTLHAGILLKTKVSDCTSRRSQIFPSFNNIDIYSKETLCEELELRGTVCDAMGSMAQAVVGYYSK